jgi:UDP-2,3-diacylglucosamine pyrophosphatase LpxH
VVSQPFLVLSDLHLAHGGSERTVRALEALLRENQGHEVVLAGDVFGLSSDPKGRDPRESVTTLLKAYPGLVAALRKHVTANGRLTFLAGNHDGALGSASMRDALLTSLELNQDAALALRPWFIRRGGVHVEHGHMWDPDNAPVHPLVPWSEGREPLGVALTRQFVARHGVYQFAHAHETTLVQGLMRAHRLFGARAPVLVLRYFAASAKICGETLDARGFAEDRSEGERALAALSAETAVAAEILAKMVSSAPTPTHTEFRETFLRLYYDRVLASASVGAGFVAATLGALPLGATLTLGGAAYLLHNVKKSGARYQNRPIRLLRHGAEVVRELSQAELVVFGHTHVPATEPGYANAGSFGYPDGPGRPYLFIEGTTATLRRQSGQ